MKKKEKVCDGVVSSSVDNIPAREILCKYIIPLYGKDIKF